MSRKPDKNRAPAVKAEEGSNDVTVVTFTGTSHLTADQAAGLAFRLSMAAERARATPPKPPDKGHHD